MKLILLAAAAVAIAGPAPAQTSTPETLILPGATPAPDCGNLYGMAGKAFCVSAPLPGISALADAYVAELEAQGWLAAGGDANRVVFVRRREGGGCDGLQMQAFYDTSRPAGPEAVGYLGFGVIPGDLCASGQPGAAASPQP
ncbi:MAG: hypothetical protein QME55_07555 [Brevundimonas sp.]|uniref:hypothetical protein n=1 Tax=Brevundimonas sp. TaxID=1871086 RepID=UPI00262E5512|nr:hypothetical protein [Brevundimonas sp.]MDI6624570.1 hypothetical protein [Brevundimonas sp.]